MFKYITLIISSFLTYTVVAQTAYEIQTKALAQRMEVDKTRAILQRKSDNACGALNATTWNRIYIDPDFCKRDREVMTWWNQTMVAPIRTNQSVPIPDISSLRMIGQVVTPRTESGEINQVAELAWFKSQGFNGVLLVWKGEPPEKLGKLAKQLKADGWMIAFTYGPEEEAETRNYVDPDKYREACKLILPYCAFAIPCWRKATFMHIKSFTGSADSAEKYRAALCGLIRDVNTTIPILGETTLQHKEDYSLLTSMHSGTSGTMVFEGAYSDYIMDKIIKYLRIQQINDPYLFLVIGPKPYYDCIETPDSAQIEQSAISINNKLTPIYELVNNLKERAKRVRGLEKQMQGLNNIQTELINVGKMNIDTAQKTQSVEPCYTLQEVLTYNVATCKTINQNKQAALMLAGGGGGTRELWGTKVSDDLTKTNWRK